MTLVFFYGTLMRPFDRAARLRIDRDLVYRARGTIAAALFDMGRYPAALPDTAGLVRGEVHEVTSPDRVLRTLDEFEGYHPAAPAASLYTRKLVPVTLDGGAVVEAFAYFYGAGLDGARRIESGDYLAYLGADVTAARGSLGPTPGSR
jgi:gamma-glutamylcyclotransferase (GGCT)/AIG2-like uncharacterized protein YtfP